MGPANPAIQAYPSHENPHLVDSCILFGEIPILFGVESPIYF